MPIRLAHPISRGFALVLALLALTAAGKVVLFDSLDPDLFWHLRVAEQLERDGIGPLVDEISYASIRESWTPYSWLAELGMKRLWDLGGYRAAVAAHAMMVAALVLLLAAICRERGAGELETLVATFFGAFLMLPYLSFRPVTFAFVLLAVAMWLMLRDRRLEYRSRAAWLLVPLTVLLINIHLFAIFVPMLLAAILATSPRDHWRRNALLLGATLLACLATPMLPGVISAIIHYQFHDPMIAPPIISEMQPFYHGPMGPAAAGMVLLALACIISNRRRMQAVEWLWLVVAIALLMKMGRMAPMFAIIVAPMFAITLPAMSQRVLARPIVQAMVAIVLALGGWRVSDAFPAPGTPMGQWTNRHGPDMRGYPTAAADYVRRHIPPRHGRIINEFSWGGYLSWALGPEFQVLLDGRTQLYSADFWRSTYLCDTETRRAFLAQQRVDAAIVPVTKSLFREDLMALGWRVAHRDERAEVWVRGERVAELSE